MVNMIRKGQIRWLQKGNIAGQVAFVAGSLGLAASANSVKPGRRVLAFSRLQHFPCSPAMFGMTSCTHVRQRTVTFVRDAASVVITELVLDEAVAAKPRHAHATVGSRACPVPTRTIVDIRSTLNGSDYPMSGRNSAR